MLKGQGEMKTRILILRHRLPSLKLSSEEQLTDADLHGDILQGCSSWDPLWKGSSWQVWVLCILQQLSSLFRD